MRLAIKRPKYNNRKMEYKGIKFDSAKECKRYKELKLLEAQGLIRDLRLQVPFVLAKRVKFHDSQRAKSALKYVADFVYTNDQGKTIVEDAKGFKTEVYRIKKHLMKAVHDIDIKEV